MGVEKAKTMDVSPLIDNRIGPFGVDVLTIEQVAEVFGKKENTIRHWVAKREIPHVMIGNKVYFRRASLNSWIESKEFKGWQ